jgi:hypothetical protein
MRHLAGVEVLLDSRIGGRSQASEDEEDLLLLYQLAGLLDRAR